MVEIPFEAYIDNKIIEKWHQYVEGKNLSAQVLSKNKLSEDFQKHENIEISLFEVPYSSDLDFDGLEKKQIDGMRGKEVDMADFPSMKVYRKPKFSVELKKDSVYDIISTGKNVEDGRRVIVGGGRLLTKKVDSVPYPITLEEMKFLALEDLDLSRESVKGIKATIEPMTAWGMSGRFIIAGFEFEKDDKSGNDKGIMVQHNGLVTHYHGYDTETIIKAMKNRKY